MKVTRIPASSGTTERRCHCGARFDGADHCPHCGCEQYERYCDASYPNLGPTHTWMPGERHAGYDPPNPGHCLRCDDALGGHNFFCPRCVRELNELSDELTDPNERP